MEDWLTAAARERPDHEAVAAGGGSVTYAELDERATRRALGLAAAGVGRGERVPVTHGPGLTFAELVHALPRLGAVLEPGPPTEPPVPAVSDPVRAGDRADARLPATSAPGKSARPRDGGEAPGRPRGGGQEPGRPRGGGQAPGPPTGGGQEPAPPRTTLEPHAVHTVIRTSGTTGAPKAVELTYANHRASALAAADALGVDPADRWLCPLPLHHVGGLAVLIRCAINRTTAVLHERFEVGRVKATLEAGEVTLASLVPTMLVRLRDAGLRRAPGLRAIALGGGPIPAGLLEWARRTGIPVVPVYGMTETASQVTAGGPGRPLRGVELRVDDGGEILVRGPMVAPGALAADGWLHTGDRGRLDGEGLLHVDGRIKELIVTGGENVAPLEVEQALLAHPAVADAAVAGRPDPVWGEAIAAFVVLREPTAPDELRAWCRERVASFKVPKTIEPVAELPRNANGKLLRDRLPRAWS